MQIVFLGIVFLVIVILLALRRPLYQAILGALIAAALLYRIPPKAILSQTARVFTDWNSFSVLISLYLITYLQRMLEARSQIKLAQLDLNGLFHNRRVNAAGAPLFIGLLPSAAAMILCADIVKDSTDGYLDPEEQAFVTSWFRHIPESTLPTYTGVLLMASLSGQPLGRFMLGMIIPMLILALVGYFPYFLRLPRDPGTPRSENRARDALNLVKHLWSLLLILVLINLLILFLGCIMSISSILLIITPIIVPILNALDYNLVQFGVVMILNLGVGLLTPPVGAALYVGSAVSGLGVGKTAKALLPFYLIMVATLFALAFIPGISRIFGAW